MEYIQITNEGSLPDLSAFKPYKCVVIIEQEVSSSRQQDVSDWLCSSGCMYMMAWGNDCTSWDDSVDFANIDQFKDEIPDESFVTTTWHDDESLKEVFWYAKHTAYHKCHELENLVILHVSRVNKATEMLKECKNA